MEFEIVQAQARLVAGRVVRTSNAEEMDVATARLPGLWRRAAGPGDMAAVLTDYESDRDGAYTQLVGREVDRVEDADVGEVVSCVPEGRYARFQTAGDVPESIIGGWRRVWEAEDAGLLQRAWVADFELWPAGGTPQIYISVAG